MKGKGKERREAKEESTALEGAKKGSRIKFQMQNKFSSSVL